MITKAPYGKAIVLRPQIYAKIDQMRLEYAYMSEKSKTFNDVISYLIDRVDEKFEQIEKEKAG